MAKSKGWIRVPREITESCVWTTNEPFGTRDAFIDLMLMVNYEEKKFLPRHSKQVLTIHEGEVLTSISRLADRWGWSEKKVLVYINRLEEAGLLVKKSYNYGTTLALVPSAICGNEGQACDSANDSTNDSTKGRTVTVQTQCKRQTTKEDKNKNNYLKKEKEIKNEPKAIGVFSLDGEPE